MISITMFRTLKFKGSSESCLLSVMQTRMTKMDRYESCDMMRLSIHLFLPFFFSPFSSPSIGKKVV